MRDIVHIADGAKLESDNKHCSNLSQQKVQQWNMR